MGNRYTDAFRGAGIPEELIESGLSLDYFAHLPNESSAREALALVTNPAALIALGKTCSESQLAQMKRNVYRACITHGVPLPSRAVVDARMLGVIVP